MDKKPAFTKKYMKNLNTAISLANASNRNEKGTLKKLEDNRYTLDTTELGGRDLCQEQRKYSPT